ncbi:hypothetical protein [Microbacterium sp. A84]|uniref:hypothetical protein n=1 Tax=Microbacterium sp. A84 TaxID=3450715 RepID=UPI003F43B9FF
MRQVTREQVPPTVGSTIVAVLLDISAIAFVSTMLWLGAGTTVLTGEPIVMIIAFAGGTVLASLSDLRLPHTRTRSAVTIALIYVFLLFAAFALRLTIIETYFFSWIIVFGGAFIAARVAVSLVVDMFHGRANDALIWRLVAISAGVAAILLLDNVWAGSTLLIDLVVYVILLSLAAALIGVGIRSLRKSSQEG